MNLWQLSKAHIVGLCFSQAAEELRKQLGKLTIMYGSGIKTLDDVAAELDGNSKSTFGDLNSEVSKHSSAIENVSKNPNIVNPSKMRALGIYSVIVFIR